jgi:hypothetical protein
MKKLFRLLLLCTGCLMSYSQNDTIREVVLKLERTNFDVILEKSPMGDNKRYVLYTVCPVTWGHSGRSVIIAFNYFWTEEEDLRSIFQNYYDWIRDIEHFANFPHRFGWEIHLKSGFNLTVSDSYIKIEDLYYDGYRYIKMSLVDITEIKNLFREYIKKHNIRVRL